MRVNYQYLIFSILFMLIFKTYAQVDTSKYLKYTPQYRFTEGIYLNFEQVRNNSPVPKERIVTSADYNSRDFFDNVTSEKKIVYYDDQAMKQEIETNEIWGYCRLGTLFVYFNDAFNRVPVVGSIAHFIADYTLRYDNRLFDPYNSYRDPFYYDPYRFPTTSTKEMREYIIDFSTGKVFDFDRDHLKYILMRDTTIYDEFNNLSKRKQKKMLFLYLRKFNERNPLWLPK